MFYKYKKLFAKNLNPKPSHYSNEMKPKSHKEKKDTQKTIVDVLVVPQEITSKRGLIMWLLENLGKKWSKISCAKALEKLNIEDTKPNRKQWYNLKSEFKQYLQKSEGGSKYQKPRVSYHNFNEASIFLDSPFTMRVRDLAISKGWGLSKSKNRFIIWRSKLGWVKWFETGRCRLHVRKPVTDGKIMQILADGFYNTELVKDIKEFTAFYRSFFLKATKMTVHLGKKSKIPSFRLEFDNGFNKLVVTNDKSHPHAIEIQYFLMRDGEQFRQYLKDSQRAMDYGAETNIQLTQVLRELLTPKPLHKDVNRMIV